MGTELQTGEEHTAYDYPEVRCKFRIEGRKLGVQRLIECFSAYIRTIGINVTQHPHISLEQLRLPLKCLEIMPVE